MVKFKYPIREDFEIFIKLVKESNYRVKKYLPPTNKEWYEQVSGCVAYVQHISSYEQLSFVETCATILYKVAKRHEFGDGNKRSSVIATYLFCLENDYFILYPNILKQQARRAAATKGRINEATMIKRLAAQIEKAIEKATVEDK